MTISKAHALIALAAAARRLRGSDVDQLVDQRLGRIGNHRSHDLVRRVEDSDR